jgi:hypothetical protein
MPISSCSAISVGVSGGAQRLVASRASIGRFGPYLEVRGDHGSITLPPAVVVVGIILEECNLR